MPWALERAAKALLPLRRLRCSRNFSSSDLACCRATVPAACLNETLPITYTAAEAGEHTGGRGAGKAGRWVAGGGGARRAASTLLIAFSM